MRIRNRDEWERRVEKPNIKWKEINIKWEKNVFGNTPTLKNLVFSYGKIFHAYLHIDNMNPVREEITLQCELSQESTLETFECSSIREAEKIVSKKLLEVQSILTDLLERVINDPTLLYDIKDFQYNKKELEKMIAIFNNE